MIDIRGLLREMKRREECARFERVFAVSQRRRWEPPAELRGTEVRATGRTPRRWGLAIVAVVASFGGNAFALAGKMQSYQRDREVEEAVAMAEQRAHLAVARSEARRGSLPRAPFPAFATARPAEGRAETPATQTAYVRSSKAKEAPAFLREAIAKTPGHAAPEAASNREAPAIALAPPALSPTSLAQAPVDLEAAIRASVGAGVPPRLSVPEPAFGGVSSGGAHQLRPSAGAIMAAIGGAQSGARRCLAAGAAPRSFRVTFRSDGSVTRVVAAGGEATGADAANACIETAFSRAHTDAFTDPSYTATVLVRP